MIYTERHEGDRSTERRSTRRKNMENENLMRRPKTGKMSKMITLFATKKQLNTFNYRIMQGKTLRNTRGKTTLSAPIMFDHKLQFDTPLKPAHTNDFAPIHGRRARIHRWPVENYTSTIVFRRRSVNMRAAIVNRGEIASMYTGL